ncbi:MAG TPA: SMI1/KNR4 family protein [Kofleriaceae bacterium]|nr:SMI1/KNR4 family protein [Kofleriaceae bacterium]
MATIRAKLALLRERRIETFGSEGHGFALDAPLDEADVRALEQKYGITLPESYRTFLLEEGAKGAGPYYGLVSPDRWGDALFGDVAMPDFAARPCVWTPGCKLEWDRVREEHAEPFQGAIVLADQGCAYYATLVTTGEARGRVMYVSLEGGPPTFVEDVDFRAWYERWLDELLMGFEHFWFGLAMPGTPESFIAIASDANHPRRGDALGAMGQLRSLSDEAKAAVALRVRDSELKVRTTALWLAKKFELGALIEPHLRRALEDSDADIRKRSFEALVAANVAWHDDARRLLADPDDGVVAQALRELDKAKVATEDDVVRVLEAKSRGSYSTAHYAARNIPSRRIFDLVREQLADGDNEYGERLQTLAAQARLGALDVPRLEALLEYVLGLFAAATGPDAPRAAPMTLRMLATPTRNVDDAAIVARAFDALVGLARHPEPYFRFDACFQLGELGNPAALHVLRELVDDAAMPRGKNSSTAWSVGENAKIAIKKLESKSSLPS